MFELCELCIHNNKLHHNIQCDLIFEKPSISALLLQMFVTLFELWCILVLKLSAFSLQTSQIACFLENCVAK